MFDYTELADIAYELLREFGQPCQLHFISESQYDITTGRVESIAQTHSAQCLFQHRAFDFSTNQNRDSNQVKQGDVMILLCTQANLNRDELLGATLEVNGERWQITHCQALKPAQTTLYFTLQGRKG